MIGALLQKHTLDFLVADSAGDRPHMGVGLLENPQCLSGSVAGLQDFGAVEQQQHRFDQTDQAVTGDVFLDLGNPRQRQPGLVQPAGAYGRAGQGL
jgi:hypothetical protein